MANYYSTRDLKKAVLTNCGELADGSSSYNTVATQYLNKFYLGVHAGASVFDIDCGDAWAWAKADNDGVLILQAPFDSGFVDVTNGSNTVNLTVPPSFSTVGWYLNATDDSETYKVILNDSPYSSITLDSEYLGSTGQKSFKLYRTDYDLTPNGDQKIMRLIDGFKVQNSENWYYPGLNWDGKIHGVDQRTLSSFYPITFPQNQMPTGFAEIRFRDGLKTVRFNGYVTKPVRLTYPYIPIPNDLVDSDTDIPNLPREFRDFLEAAATYKLMLDKDDTRAPEYAAMAKATIMALVRAGRVETSFTSIYRGEIIARPNQVAYRRWGY